MNALVLEAVITSAGMDEDAAYIIAMWAHGWLARELIVLSRAINGSGLGSRHVLVLEGRQASAEVAQMWTEFIHLCTIHYGSWAGSKLFRSRRYRVCR